MWQATKKHTQIKQENDLCIHIINLYLTSLEEIALQPASSLKLNNVKSQRIFLTYKVSEYRT